MLGLVCLTIRPGGSKNFLVSLWIKFPFSFVHKIPWVICSIYCITQSSRIQPSQHKLSILFIIKYISDDSFIISSIPRLKLRATHQNAPYDPDNSQHWSNILISITKCNFLHWFLSITSFIHHEKTNFNHLYLLQYFLNIHQIIFIFIIIISVLSLYNLNIIYRVWYNNIKQSLWVRETQYDQKQHVYWLLLTSANKTQRVLSEWQSQRNCTKHKLSDSAWYFCI